jgi:hypothetical protein
MVGRLNVYGLRKSVSNLPLLIENATRAIPGFVPVTLMETVTLTAPVTKLPELGVVKQMVTLYAPDEGVLVAQVLPGLGVGVCDGVAVGVGVSVAVEVGFGVGLPLE